MTPGEYILDEQAGPIEANAGRRTVRIIVRNTGDRPVQIGSHFHFFEVNRELDLISRPARRFVLSPGKKRKSSLRNLPGSRLFMDSTVLWKARLPTPHCARERSIARGNRGFNSRRRRIDEPPNSAPNLRGLVRTDAR